MKLIFERSNPGKLSTYMPANNLVNVNLPADKLRQTRPRLPKVAEITVSRHYTELSNNTFGVNNGFFPLGSCTMKYNPIVNEKIAGMAGFKDIHPLQEDSTIQGALEVFHQAEEYFCEITGMDNMTFQPSAGAHGELTGVLLMKAYHLSRGDTHRTKILVPDSAHGTNPATASMAGFSVVTIPSDEHGRVSLDAFKAAIDENLAGIMLTNPNTLGIFEKDVPEIIRLVHEAGGLAYYDGANLNAIMGKARPGDMDFDIVHLNLHKTFSTPHGGGGPGSGPVGCKAFLSEYMPGPVVIKEDGVFKTKTPSKSIGRVKAFYGNFLVALRALAYVKRLGYEGLKESCEQAVLNANYMKERLEDKIPLAYKGACMHEFVLTLAPLKKETGVGALDFSKSLLDEGMHPPTMYFPLVVPEALMVEPTETESKEEIDHAIEVYRKLYDMAYSDPEYLKTSPHTTKVKRPDEVKAAREPILKFTFGK